MYNVKVKTYYDGRKVYQFSTNPICGRSGFVDLDKPEKENEERKEENKDRSHRRTKNEIYDIAFNNPWEYFITVTFDSQKVDRYNYEAVNKKYSQMLKNLKKRLCPDLQYIFVPELHKDGGIHFHGLLKGVDGLTLKNSGKKDKAHRIIWNSSDFKLGFNTLTKIGDPAKAATYISKYISKEISSTITGKHYWFSRGLNKIQEKKMMYTDLEMQKVLIQDLYDSQILAGFYHTSVKTSTYENNFTYIITHPGANGDMTRAKTLIKQNSL